MAFTDGDRQFKVADLGRLTARLAEADQPDVVVGFRIKRADPLIRTLYARAYRLGQPDLLRPEGHRRRLRLQALPARGARGLRVESGGAFFSAEMLIKLRAAGRTVVEVGVPHYPRTAGSATGAKPQVVFRAVRDFWLLRLRLWANGARALRRGEPMVGRRERRDGARTSSKSTHPDCIRNALDMAGATHEGGRPPGRVTGLFARSDRWESQTAMVFNRSLRRRCPSRDAPGWRHSPSWCGR